MTLAIRGLVKSGIRKDLTVNRRFSVVAYVSMVDWGNWLLLINCERGASQTELVCQPLFRMVLLSLYAQGNAKVHPAAND